MGKAGKKFGKRADPPPPPLRVSVAGHPVLTVIFLALLFVLYLFADLPWGSYLILAILGYYIHSLCGPVLSFDYHLLLRTPPSEWFQIADGVLTSHKNLVTPSGQEQLEKKTDKKFKTDMLTKFDPFFQAQAG